MKKLKRLFPKKIIAVYMKELHVVYRRMNAKKNAFDKLIFRKHEFFGNLLPKKILYLKKFILFNVMQGFNR